MDEIIARLTAIESRLESLYAHISNAQENCETYNQRRFDDLDRLEGKLRDLERSLYYEVGNVRSEIGRSNRGY